MRGTRRYREDCRGDGVAAFRFPAPQGRYNQHDYGVGSVSNSLQHLVQLGRTNSFHCPWNRECIRATGVWEFERR